jgi:hypothetical protein
MTTLSLSHQEAQLVSQLFQQALEELRVEVRHTDRLDYKEELKEQERMLQGLIIKVERSRYAEVEKEKVH